MAVTEEQGAAVVAGVAEMIERLAWVASFERAVLVGVVVMCFLLGAVLLGRR